MIITPVPKSKTSAGAFLLRASEYINKEMSFPSDNTCIDMGKRTYHDRKASQLLEAMGDLLIAEARIESWFVDLGFVGCQGDDNSIGGIPCIAGEEDVIN